eukprot:3190749-Pyramimonas_sp.AAC.1
MVSKVLSIHSVSYRVGFAKQSRYINANSMASTWWPGAGILSRARRALGRPDSRLRTVVEEPSPHLTGARHAADAPESTRAQIPQVPLGAPRPRAQASAEGS